jgi:phenylpyruvate tautomerase PptA (4-oxalocrotonate tautomerase family)
MPIIAISTYSDRMQQEKDRLAEAITDKLYENWYAEGTRL